MPSPPQKFDFGPQHGTFTVVREIGRGSFGSAYLCKRNSTNEEFAVKCVNLTTMKSAAERKAALDEVKIMAKNNDHPHIIKYYASFEKDGILNILLEYADCGDVQKTIIEKSKSPLPEQTIGILFTQLASSLAYLHSRRTLHRDIASKNIFLKSVDNNNSNESSSSYPLPYVVKVGDLGIAKQLNSTAALTKTVCGTPYSFSPELCLGAPYNNKTDVWASACVLVELALIRNDSSSSPKRAFDANSLKSLMQKILKGSFTPIDTNRYSRSMADLVKSMFEQKVEKRPSMRQCCASEFVRRYVSVAFSYSSSSSESVSAGAAASSSSPPPSSVPPPSNLSRALPFQQQQQQRQKQQQLDLHTRNPRMAVAAAAREQVQSKAKQVEDMKYIKRRVELESYEDQQRYVDRARVHIARVKQAQDDRQRVRDQRTTRIEELKSKLNLIEKRHNELRFQRESREREAEAFNQHLSLQQEHQIRQQQQEDRYHHHEQFQQQPSTNHDNTSSLLGPPRAEPTAAELANFYKNRNYAGAQIFGNQQPQQQQLKCVGKTIAPSSLKVDNTFRGRRDFDDDYFENNLSPNNMKKDNEAENLWQLQQERIRVAREIELQQSLKEKQLKQVHKAKEEAKDEDEYQQWLANESWDAEEEEEEEEEFAEFEDRREQVQQQQQQPYQNNNHNNLLFNPFFGDDDADDANEFFEDEQQQQQTTTDPIAITAKMIQKKFTLDGKTLKLPGVSEMSPASARSLALKQFLVLSFGNSQQLFDEFYGKVKNIETIDDVDEADVQMQLLETDPRLPVGANLIDLIVQLRICEASADE